MLSIAITDLPRRLKAVADSVRDYRFQALLNSGSMQSLLFGHVVKTQGLKMKEIPKRITLCIWPRHTYSCNFQSPSQFR